MVALNPQTLHLASQAASALIRVIPKSKLAQLGLSRAPFLTVAPLAGVAVGGLAVAFAIPQSRNWIFGQANRVADVVRQTLQSAEEKVAQDEVVDGATVSSSDAMPSNVGEVN